MAKMLPYPIETFKYSHEEMLYHLFEKVNLDYTIFFSRTWSQVVNGGNPDPECDFIIAKPGQGIIVIEAKGGRWERKNGTWHANGSQVANSNDPFIQAKTNKTSLINLLRKPVKWQRTFFPVSYAIALPETRFPIDFDTTGFPPILSYDEIGYLKDWVASAMQECLQQNYPSVLTQEMYDYLVETLMKDYSMSLRDILDINENQLYTLTEQQLELDRSFQNLKKLTIQGCAGSGKTLMAIKQAKRLAQTPSVRTILFTCFNLELGDWLARQTYSIRQRCTTKPFLVFCEEQLIQHGILTGKEKKTPDYYNDLPYRLIDIIDLHNIKFDAIIVDEGQTFKNDWWIAIDWMLKDSDKSYRYIFFDDFQKIYEETQNQVPDEDRSFSLYVNIRNTAKIHRKAIRFLPQDRPLPKCNSIEGEDVWFATYDDEGSMKYELQKTLTALIRDGGVSSKDIVLLRGRNKTSRLINGERLGPYTLSDLENNSNPASIRFTTIQAFRGMERKVVILTELDEETINLEQLNYLGASRAKTMLVYLVSEKIVPQMLNALKEDCQIRN